MASTRSWPGLRPHPERCIIHPNDGLIHVIRSRPNPVVNVPARTAGPAICGAYAW